MSQNESSPGVCFRKEEREPSWETDLLGRKDAAHQLERLIANAPGPYVIAMTSEWGSGKTFFLKAWGKDLLARKRPCVYFNAWETDHAGDPLLALTGCITESLKKNKFIAPRRLNKLAQTASNIFAKSPKIFCRAAVGVVDKATGGGLAEVKDEILDTMDLGTDLFLKNNKRRADFVEQLKTIAAEASEKAQKLPADEINGTNHFPLFVMIDELDRCRPNYAIELLENVKHLFNASGVVFLLALDGYQILNVIEHTFGLRPSESYDKRHDYLKKFIDIFWTLPAPDARSFVYASLIDKKVPYPKDWPVFQFRNFRLLDFKEDDPLFNGLSFYKAIACGAEIANKKLRDYTIIIDKFNIISLTYKLSTRESFLIFRILLNITDEFSNPMQGITVAQEDYQPGKQDPPYQIDLNDDFYKALYLAIEINTSNQRDVIIRDSVSGTLPESLMDQFLYHVIKDFSGKNLLASVTSKIALLDKFNFGEDLAETESETTAI